MAGSSAGNAHWPAHKAWALQSEHSKRPGKKLQGFFSFVLFFVNDTDLCFKCS